MKVIRLFFVLPIIIIDVIGCSKNGEVKTSHLQEGIYSLSSTVNFDAPILYTNQGATTDKNIISNFLNNFSPDTIFAYYTPDYIPDTVKNDFELNAGNKTFNEPLSNSIIKILSDSVAMIIKYPTIKDSVICDIQANADDTYTLTARDSSVYYVYPCNELEIEMCNISEFRKSTLSNASGIMTIYIGKDSYVISIENGQIMLHSSSLITSQKSGCWSILKNSLKKYNPSYAQLSIGDTVIMQNKEFIYKKDD